MERANVTKPKPRERRVVQSRITIASFTTPNCSKYARSLSVNFTTVSGEAKRRRSVSAEFFYKPAAE
jgi:hypothetical protein